MLSDFHMHSWFSGDSDENPENNIKKAIELKMKHICFTDHQDFNYKYNPGYFDLDYNSYFNSLNSLKEKYKDFIDIRIGLEIGLEPHLKDTTEEFASKMPYDFCIASTHLIDGNDPYSPEYFEGRSEKECFKEYFEYTLENIKLCNNFDVYGHIDYIKRYAPNKDKNFNYEDHKELIDEILTSLIKKDKGIEINTASLYKGMSETNPNAKIVKRYKELGGRIITVGADAHTFDKVGYGFDIAKEILISSGFKEYCIFKNRKPSFICIS